MQIRELFINSVGRLLSGWRVLLFCVAFLGINFVLVTSERLVYAIGNQVVPTLAHSIFLADIVFRLTLLVSALGAGYLCTRWLEDLPWRSLGLTFHTSWFRDLIIGSAVGLGSLGLAVGFATVAGGLRFNAIGTATQIGKSLLASAFLFIIAALAEEAIFRGYPLQTLFRAGLIWLGVLLTSVPFATVHLGNPNVVPVVTFANTALAGVWLAVAYLRTRTLWFPVGVHWAWNWALGSLFGLPVSGILIVSHPLVQGTDLGPAWLTGGSYGIEGGVACTMALLLSILFIWRTKQVSPTPEMKRLTSEENPAKRAAGDYSGVSTDSG